MAVSTHHPLGRLKNPGGIFSSFSPLDIAGKFLYDRDTHVSVP